MQKIGIAFVQKALGQNWIVNFSSQKYKANWRILFQLNTIQMNGFVSGVMNQQACEVSVAALFQQRENKLSFYLI